MLAYESQTNLFSFLCYVDSNTSWIVLCFLLCRLPWMAM